MPVSLSSNSHEGVTESPTLVNWTSPSQEFNSLTGPGGVRSTNTGTEGKYPVSCRVETVWNVTYTVELWAMASFWPAPTVTGSDDLERNCSGRPTSVQPMRSLPPAYDPIAHAIVDRLESATGSSHRANACRAVEFTDSAGSASLHAPVASYRVHAVLDHTPSRVRHMRMSDTGGGRDRHVNAELLAHARPALLVALAVTKKGVPSSSMTERSDSMTAMSVPML